MHPRQPTIEIPDLTNRYAVVTGAGRLLGRMIIQRLSDHGANVFAISRDEVAVDGLGPGVEPMRMNPTSMESIHHGAQRIRDHVPHVDILIHAASISIAPDFRTGEDHNLMVATNYLGFVMLSHELAPALRRSDSPRVVLAESGEIIHQNLELDHLDDDMDRDAAYNQSRLAAMMFVLELDHRARQRRPSLVSAVAEGREPHPTRSVLHPFRSHLDYFTTLVQHHPDDAPVLPIIYTSTSLDVRGGEYYDIHDRARRHVAPNPAKIPDAAKNATLRSQLWERTEDMLGMRLEVA
jgi:NAD(P)-dependent dehydrogenase (short-subunit alcohol dehydrogenase family)